MTPCCVAEPGGVQLVAVPQSDQHGGHPGPEARDHLRVPGPSPHGGRVRTLQREDVLPDHDRRYSSRPPTDPCNIQRTTHTAEFIYF